MINGSMFVSAVTIESIRETLPAEVIAGKDPQLEKAIEIQSEYAKSAYEGFVAGATRIGELYADLAKETYKPFETVVAKASGK